MKWKGLASSVLALSAVLALLALAQGGSNDLAAPTKVDTSETIPELPGLSQGAGYVADAFSLLPVAASGYAPQLPSDVAATGSNSHPDVRGLPSADAAAHPPPQGAPLDELASVVCHARYEWDCAWAVRVVLCESGGDPTPPESGFFGLWQIDYWFEGWSDPVVNTAAAWRKYENAIKYWGDGAHPWPYCGRY